MAWVVVFHDEFDPEFEGLAPEVQDELYARLKLLARFGPETGRPHVDTLNGSHHSNMKELRFDAAGGVWRVAFAFDPKRRAVLLVAGDKHGVSQKPFYKHLIKVADGRYSRHLQQLERTEHASRDTGKQPQKKARGATKR